MRSMSSARPEAAKALLADVEEWCARTKTPETSVGHALFRHPGFVGLLRLRLMLSEEKEFIVRRFMVEWPRGYHGELPYMFAKQGRRASAKHPVRESAARMMSDEEIATRRINREPCRLCGVRADIGCKHGASFRPPDEHTLGGVSIDWLLSA